MIGPDKLEYASVADRLLGRPDENLRNEHILAMRRDRIAEEFVGVFCATYDTVRPHVSADDAFYTAVRAVTEARHARIGGVRAQTKADVATYTAERIDRAAYDLFKTVYGV